MEATGGSDGGRWRWRWSSRRKHGGSSSYSTSSSRSGTIVSSTATNTSRSGVSRISSLSTAAAAMHLDLEIHGDEDMFSLEARKEARRKHIEGMVQEFFAAAAVAPSANCSGGGGGGDMSVLERWFADLGVAWVLHLAADDGAPAATAADGELEYASAVRRWIWALNEITETIVLMSPRSSNFPGFDVKPSVICEDEEGSSGPDQFQIAHFFQQAMLRMLAFVDAVVDEDQCLVTIMNRVPVPPLVKLGSLLHLRVALSKASSKHQYHSPQPTEAWSETGSLLSAKEDKTFEAIWSTMEGMRTRFMEPTEDSSGTQTPQASPAIHKLTESVMGYITFLQNNYSDVASVVSRAAGLGKYVPTIKHKDMLPVHCMIMEMTICLEQKLVSISESFPDQGLRFLFLLNNLDLMRDTLRFYTQFFPVECLGKTETYKERYLQVSWAPVLSSLLSPTAPSCLGRNYSPLSKFESEFQKTYTAQKLWKVQDPKLRKTLRAAVIQEIVPGYTKYIEDNSVATAKFPPKVLKEMLEELFEG